jgi:hypothetical protein
MEERMPEKKYLYGASVIIVYVNSPYVGRGG